MLQETKNFITSTFNDSFIKRLSLYLHDCVREEVKSATFRNLKQDKDNKWIFLKQDEFLFNNFPEDLRLDGSDSRLTELMIQTEMSQKDKYLIYGYLFIVGTSGKSRRKNEFLTPLLYMPCKLERDGLNIICSLQDETLSLNTGALTSLMKKSDDEDETELLLDGLLEVVPDLPLTQEKLEIFLTTLKSIIPDIEIELNHEEDVSEENLTANTSANTTENNTNDENEDENSKTKIKLDKVYLTNQSSIVLTKRPQITAGVLHELTQISEKPSGTFRETALKVINEEFMQAQGKLQLKTDKKDKEKKEFIPVTPLALSDSQESVIKKIEENPLLAVYGPPGTGKSQTIVNLVAHLIANGKTVLVASRMDKATDVVAERLNELGAPFLALRAGRPNYQKQLKFQLQDLLSNKIDLDTGFENSILVDVKDMQKLLQSIKDCERKIEEILKLEQTWQELSKQIENKQKTISEKVFIKQKIKKNTVAELKNLIETIEKNLDASGIFSIFINKIKLNKLKKLLNLKSFVMNFEELNKLKTELSLAEIEAEANFTESQIYKLGNTQELLAEMHSLRKKQKTLAIEILKNKRRESLKGLLRDQIKRQRLMIHSKALTEKKKNLQNRLLEEEDFKPLLEAFPCWCTTTYAISNSLPMKAGLFDVAIIDEASQCDIASCFPVLFRAKKAVIVGDDKQLPHLSFLEKAKEQSFISQYSIPDRYQLMWRFRTNSMFDLANYYSTSPVLLDEHFRSLPPIINFSNQEFYGSRIRIMKENTTKKDVLELNIVPDGKVDFDITRNVPEVESVMNRLHEIIFEDERLNPDNPVSIGIISPFRGQVDALKKAVMTVLSESTIRKHQIEVGTAHTFQGDERDIIILSWAIAPNSFNQSLMFLQKPNLFNVAITRARKRLINFLSKQPKDLPEGLLRNYIDYIQTYIKKSELEETNSDFDESIYKNDFEKIIAFALRAEGLKVKAGVEIAGLNTDLYVTNPENNKTVLVEIDGVEDNIRQTTTNTKKQSILERSGYKVVRLSYREWYYSRNVCIERVQNEII